MDAPDLLNRILVFRPAAALRAVTVLAAVGVLAIGRS
jgi:hypothetical protein